MHVCLTIKYYKIMGGDKIVLLDGAGNTGGWVTNPTRPITMETTDTTVTDLRCVEVADVEEVVLIEEQTQRIQLIRNM